MSGDDDGKTPTKGRAENWGRRDNIRAGAVSGPWRSAPRSTTKPDTPPEQVSPAESNIFKRRHLPGKPTEIREEPGLPGRDTALGTNTAPLPSSTNQPLRDTTGAPTQPKRIGLVSTVILAILIASGFVAAAWYLRIDPLPKPDISPPTAVEIRNDAQTPGSTPTSIDPQLNQTGITTAQDMPSTPQDTAAIESASIRLRIYAGLPAERLAAITSALYQQGYLDIEIEKLSFHIALSRVGYFHPEDRPSAEQLAGIAAQILEETNDMFPVRNYEELSPDEQPGNLDLWVKS